MSIDIINKRIKKRGREIRNFIGYINKNFIISHKVSVNITDFPCVFADNREPVFGVFYPYYSKSFKIEIANNIEYYRKDVELSENQILYLVLHTIAHEIYHYLQYKEKHKTIENWVDYQAHKMLQLYMQKCPRDTNLIISSIYNYSITEEIQAINPNERKASYAHKK